MTLVIERYRLKSYDVKQIGESPSRQCSIADPVPILTNATPFAPHAGLPLSRTTLGHCSQACTDRIPILLVENLSRMFRGINVMACQYAKRRPRYDAVQRCPNIIGITARAYDTRIL